MKWGGKQTEILQCWCYKIRRNGRIKSHDLSDGVGWYLLSHTVYYSSYLNKAIS